MLGPGVNLARVPWNGRNFEDQGEDDYLASLMVHAEVIGIQSQNVSGCVKHCALSRAPQRGREARRSRPRARSGGTHRAHLRAR
jgi:beta-glucosidase-like glycosyl hydrolase